MLFSAGENLHGYKLSEFKDIVFGVANSQETSDYRQLALKRMGEAADKLGANSVINCKLEIYAISGAVQEATAYGNAVIADPIDGVARVTEKPKVKLEAFIPKAHTEQSPKGKIFDVNGYKFVVCPKCGTKYKIEKNEKGEIYIKGFDDIDEDEPGLQVFCLRCGSKFTVPEME